MEAISPKVLIILPAYNAQKTLGEVYAAIPKDKNYETLLVDDFSQDATVAEAQKLGIECVIHKANRGYGGNQKTCYQEALRKGADIVVMLHPDGQYPAEYIPDLVGQIFKYNCDAVTGSRMAVKRNAIKGGMPFWKFVSNVALSAFANKHMGSELTDWHCGFRAYTSNVLRQIDFLENSEGFDFDVQMTVEIIKKGMFIKELPIPTKYFPEASSINFINSVIYGLKFIKIVRNSNIK